MNPKQTYPWTPWLIWLVAIPAGMMAGLLGALVLAERADLRFDAMDCWWLILVVPLASALFVYGLLRRRRALIRFASADLADLLTPSVSPGRQAIKSGLVVLALMGVAVAVIGPRWGFDYLERRATGIDVMVVLDVSRSMLAEDIPPNRLEAAKRRIERLIARQSNRIGLMAFAGKAALKCPLTLDYGFARMILQSIGPDSVTKPGTDIANALQEAAKAFTDPEKDDSKAILLITDGEDHGGYAEQTARDLFKNRRIRIFTVGIGDATRGRRIPVTKDGTRTYLKYQGREVWSKMDPTTLMQIAQAAGGRYAPIEQFTALMHEFDRLEKKQLKMAQQKRYRPQYQWFLAAAMVMLALETFLSDRRSRIDATYRRLWERRAA